MQKSPVSARWVLVVLLGIACGRGEETEAAVERTPETTDVAESTGAAASEEPEDSSFAAVEVDPAVARQEILGLSDQWIARLRSYSVEGTVELYAEGGVAMPPYRQAVSGRAGLGEYFETFFGQGVDQFTMSTDDITISGDWAFVRGTYSFRALAEEGGRHVVHTGKWGSIDQRQEDGSWKVVGNLWNTDAPPTGVPAPQIPRYGAAPATPDPLCVDSLAALDAAFERTFTEGDLANLLAIHAEDAIRMPPEMGRVAGRNELAGFFGYFLTSFPSRDLTLSQVGRVRSGDVGSTWGAYRFTYARASGQTVSGRGKYLGVGHRSENGCWVLDWAIWNGDAPPAVATGA